MVYSKEGEIHATGSMVEILSDLSVGIMSAINMMIDDGLEPAMSLVLATKMFKTALRHSIVNVSKNELSEKEIDEIVENLLIIGFEK